MEEEGQCVRVALRVRPLSAQEEAKSGELCLSAGPEGSQLVTKAGARQFKFTYNLGPEVSQQSLFETCRVSQYVESALQGYSTTIFAYGQTGSGKTFTITGPEDKSVRDLQGLIPRSIRLLFKLLERQKEKVTLKASFLEIYNEQIHDLLNPSSGVLHCRWNSSNGFFVEDQIVVECTSEEDLLAVLREGVRNRKTATHELNKDSSRSHSIMTIWTVSQGQTVSRFGKLSFVDLAGSERLRESKSQGEMVRETGNINRSLFILGKVIKVLSDRKGQHVPYRDSKLTMLLMDSLGGHSKALMVACASPSILYLEETASTLNYATRAMNIKNVPLLQVDRREQTIIQVRQQIEQLKAENAKLREELHGQPRTVASQQSRHLSAILPPLSKGAAAKEKNRSQSQASSVINQYRRELVALQHKIQEARLRKGEEEAKYLKLVNENNGLQTKLQSLETVFVGESIGGRASSLLLSENGDLRARLEQVQRQEKVLKKQGEDKESKELDEAVRLGRELDSKQAQIGGLDERVRALQRRQRQLLQEINRKRK